MEVLASADSKFDETLLWRIAKTDAVHFTIETGVAFLYENNGGKKPLFRHSTIHLRLTGFLIEPCLRHRLHDASSY